MNNHEELIRKIAMDLSAVKYPNGYVPITEYETVFYPMARIAIKYMADTYRKGWVQADTGRYLSAEQCDEYMEDEGLIQPSAQEGGQHA